MSLNIKFSFFNKTYGSTPLDCAQRDVLDVTDREMKIVIIRLATIDDYESITRRPAPVPVLTAINERRCYLIMF